MASTNYAANGEWLGITGGGNGQRVCGYTTAGRVTASVVTVKRVDCAVAASVIHNDVVHHGQAVRGWELRFLRLRAPITGGPTGTGSVIGELLGVAAKGQAFKAMLSTGRTAAPEPIVTSGVDVRFGCSTRSSICANSATN